MRWSRIGVRYLRGRVRVGICIWGLARSLRLPRCRVELLSRDQSISDMWSSLVLAGRVAVNGRRRLESESTIVIVDDLNGGLVTNDFQE